MRIISVSTSSNNGVVTIHMELIKPLRTRPISYDDSFKIPRASQFNTQADVEQRVAIIHAKIDSTDKEPQRFLARRIDITLSSSAEQTLLAIGYLKLFFKPDSANIILIDDEANLAKFIPQLTTLKSSLERKKAKAEFNFPMTLNEYIHLKKETKPHRFTQDLIAHILHKPENKTYAFLSAFYLLDPEKKDRTDILKNLSLFFINPEHRKIREAFMTSLNRFAKEAFIAPCLGKIADDGRPYNDTYTEILTFNDSQFILTEDKCVQINPLDTFGYKEWYQQGQRNCGKLQDEWIHMGNMLGIEFDKQSIWDKSIILTKESSEFFILKGLLYDEKFMENMQKNLEKITLFRHGFFYDNGATNRQMNSDVIHKITADFVQLAESASP